MFPTCRRRRVRGNSIGFWTAVAIVVGNIVGSGVFLLPASLAPFGGLAFGGWLVAAGGALSGEHGIGLEKRDYMPLMFGPDDLAAQELLRDAFDPLHLANPSKVLPSPATCGDVHSVPEGAWI